MNQSGQTDRKKKRKKKILINFEGENNLKQENNKINEIRTINQFQSNYIPE